MVKILVTGGAGFIGSHLVDRLIEEGHTVGVVDNLVNGNEKFVNKNAVLFYSDIRNDLDDLFRTNKFDYIFHLAAMAKIAWCTDHPIESNEVNVVGTLNLLRLAKKYEVKGFIYSSSSSVYGEVDRREPIFEDQPINPISIYALQKYTAERYVTLSDVPSICLRYFNVYGTNRQRPNGAYPNVFSAFMRDSKKEKYLTIYGNGKQRRDFIHVYDVVEANICAMNALQYKYFKESRVFNIGTGRSTSINTIAKLFKTPIVYEHPRLGDPLYSCANPYEAELYLNFKAKISIKEGFKILKESYKKKGYYGLEK